MRRTTIASASHPRSLGSGSAWTAGLASLLISAGCTHPKPAVTPIPPDVLSPDCLEYAHAQEALADLGLQAMQAFGRVDPTIYVPSEQSLSPNPDLAQPEGEKSERFRKALARVTGDAKTLEAFKRGYAAATQVCADGACPGTAYSISVERIETPKHDAFFGWKVAAPAFPSVLEWRAFIELYAPRPGLCPVLPSLKVRTRGSGTAQTEGLFGGEEEGGEASLKPRCPCIYDGGPGRGSPCSDCPYYSFAATGQCPLE